jgi:hypothetical protein
MGQRWGCVDQSRQALSVIPRKSGPERGSHLPVMVKLLSITDGPVLELGGGMYSTPMLHWLCYPTRRPLVTIDNNRRYQDFLMQFDKEHHRVLMVDDYKAVDLSPPWSVVLVDHSPETERVGTITRLTHAEYVVAHDADNSMSRRYRYPSIYHLFKYRWKYTGARPKTAVFSNFHNLSGFTV